MPTPIVRRRIITAVAALALCTLITGAALLQRLRARQRGGRALAVQGSRGPAVMRLRADALTSTVWRVFPPDARRDLNFDARQLDDDDVPSFWDMRVSWEKGWAAPHLLHEVFDAFYSCSRQTLVVVGRPHSGEAMRFLDFRAALTVGADNAAPLAPSATLGAWSVSSTYETIAVGHWYGLLTPADADAVCSRAAPLWLRLLHGPGARDVSLRRILHVPLPERDARAWAARAARAVLRAPAARAIAPPLAAPFAVCTTIKDAVSPALLKTFLDYYSVLGVGSFYIFAVTGGPPSGAATLAKAIAAAAARAEHARSAAVTVIPFPFPFWQVSLHDANYAQQVALNVCTQRYADAHEWLLMYDIDELLVLPGRDGLASWAAALARRFGGLAAVRTRMAWSVVGVVPRLVNSSAYHAFAGAPRPAPPWGEGSHRIADIFGSKPLPTEPPTVGDDGTRRGPLEGQAGLLLRDLPPSSSSGTGRIAAPPFWRSANGTANVSAAVAAAHAAAIALGDPASDVARPIAAVLARAVARGDDAAAGVYLNLTLACSAWVEGGPDAVDDAFNDDWRNAFAGWGTLEFLLERFCFLPSGRPRRYSHRVRTAPPLLGTPLSSLSLEALLKLPLARSPVLDSGREKYALNASALREREAATHAPLAVNIHGVYELDSVAPELAFTAFPGDIAYHLHLLNADARGAETQAMRVLAFFLNKMAVNQSALVGPGVFPAAPHPLNESHALALELDAEAQPALAAALRARVSWGGSLPRPRQAR